MLVQKTTQIPDDGRSGSEHAAYFRVDGQVGITLAGAEFYVVQGSITHNGTVFLGHVFVGGERRNGFGEQVEVEDLKRRLAGFGAHHHAGRFYKVTEIEHLVEEGETILPNFVHAQE